MIQHPAEPLPTQAPSQSENSSINSLDMQQVWRAHPMRFDVSPQSGLHSAR